MRKGAKIALSSSILIVIVVAAAIAAWFIRMPRRSAPPPSELVPSSWQAFRTSSGHETSGFQSPGVAPCSKCHANQVAHTHAGGDPKKTDCLTCHTFAPAASDTVTASAKCVECHSTQQGHAGAVKQHATTNCGDCHKVHGDPAIAPKDCVSCHKERSPRHDEHAGSKGCQDCHSAHTPASEA